MQVYYDTHHKVYRAKGLGHSRGMGPRVLPRSPKDSHASTHIYAFKQLAAVSGCRERYGAASSSKVAQGFPRIHPNTRSNSNTSRAKVGDKSKGLQRLPGMCDTWQLIFYPAVSAPPLSHSCLGLTGHLQGKENPAKHIFASGMRP